MPASDTTTPTDSTALENIIATDFIPDNWFNMDIVSPEETLFRVGCAVLFGFILGFERGRKNKPMDFRAYMIVAAASCIIAIMGQELSTDYANNTVVTLDLGKIISGVLTGIGFIGAGAIIKVEKDQIVGSATGASIWAAGGIGLCLGFGMYGLAIIGFIAVVCILILGGLLEPRQSPDDTNASSNTMTSPDDKP